MRIQIAALLAVLLVPLAEAEPLVKVINFTADWCPNCRIIDPRIREAMERFDAGSIDYVELDMSPLRGASPAVREATYANAIRLASEHRADYLWDWYGGVTGLSVVVSADTGEAISCIMRPMTVGEIEFRLIEAQILTARRPAGARMPDGPDCPAPERL